MQTANEVAEEKKSNQINACYLYGLKKMNNLLWNCMSYSICDNVKRRTYTIKKSVVAAVSAAADVYVVR